MIVSSTLIAFYWLPTPITTASAEKVKAAITTAKSLNVVSYREKSTPSNFGSDGQEDNHSEDLNRR